MSRSASKAHAHTAAVAYASEASGLCGGGGRWSEGQVTSEHRKQTCVTTKLCTERGIVDGHHTHGGSTPVWRIQPKNEQLQLPPHSQAKHARFWAVCDSAPSAYPSIFVVFLWRGGKNQKPEMPWGELWLWGTHSDGATAQDLVRLLPRNPQGIRPQ